MKRSDKVALGMGGLTAAIGIGAALLCPLAGLVAGGIFTYGAVSATMGLGATVALTAAGAVGGLVLGKIAAPIVGWGSIALAGLIGGATKAVGSLFEDEKPQASAARPRRGIERERMETGRRFDATMELASSFKAGGQPRRARENKPQPQPKRFLGLRL